MKQTRNIDRTELMKHIGDQFEHFKETSQYDKIAGLLSYVVQNHMFNETRHMFGYVPGIFPEIEIPDPGRITRSDLCIGEPVIYKVHYGGGKRLYDIPYFYLFCYFKEDSRKLNVFFQGADRDFETLTADDYLIGTEKIRFAGHLSAFYNNEISVISISDPGQFIPGFTTGYHAGSGDINFNRLAAAVLETLGGLAGVPSRQTLLFGSASGSMGALLAGSYYSDKVNVLAVNSPIHIEDESGLMVKLFGTSDREELAARYGDQVSCTHRFRQRMDSVPNIYMLANVNDRLYRESWEFFRLYQETYTARGKSNQSVFDSYCGIDGHGIPSYEALRIKIRIAREVLTMDSTGAGTRDR